MNNQINKSDTDLSRFKNLEFRIKNHISNNEKLWNKLASLSGKDEIRSELHKIKDEFDDDEFDKTIDKISSEIIELRKNPGQYLIDTNGKPIIKLTDDMLYQPPPVAREDGSMAVLPPRLHPRISSGIALTIHEMSKISKLEAKFPNSQALVCLRDPWSIVEEASKEILKRGGPAICEYNDDSLNEIRLKIGVENVNGVFQSFNPQFIRHVVYGKNLANKILELNAKEYMVISCAKQSDSKLSWYDVIIHYK